MTPVGKIGIPEARQVMKGIAFQLEHGMITAAKAAEALRSLEYQFIRNPALRKAPRQSRPVDSKLAAKMRAELKANPQLTIQAVAVAHGTNSGRASEALHHLR